MRRDGSRSVSEQIRARFLVLAIPLTLAWFQACDCDTPPTNDAGFECNCSAPFVCDDAGLCVRPPTDAGDMDIPDSGDVDVTPDTVDERSGCTDATENEDCAAGQYCDDGECEPGCRVDPDNCGDCDLYPNTCEDDFHCSPNSRECVAGCEEDDDCEDHQYCDPESGCEEGCRIEPNNCPIAPVGEVPLVCDEVSRRCQGSACRGDEICLEGFYCDPDLDVCLEGCRSEPDNCGSGLQCDTESHSCEATPCTCAEDDDPETCDAFCNDDGRISAFYCEESTETCQPGCRIRNDGSDTCRPGTLCDLATHTCIDGCHGDADCPFGTYCDLELDNPVCSPGCKPGECGKDTHCCPDHVCCAEECATDEDCWDGGDYNGLYCNGEFCEDGCLPDDPETEADEDTCFDELICDPETRDCGIPRCDPDGACDECPLGEFCSPTLQRCIPGCDGDECHCPDGQVCSVATDQCGCVADEECPLGTHCSTPECEVDCTPESDETEDSCPDGQSCNPLTGRCQSGCLDALETDVIRDDTRSTATCIPFYSGDAVVSFRDCTGSTDLRPCDDTEDSWCADATASTGADFDHYVMYLNAGDRISVHAQSEGFIAMSFFNNGGDVVFRPTDSEVPTDVQVNDYLVPESELYFVQVFTVGLECVDYSLEVLLDRPFLCEADPLEVNNSTISATPLGSAGRLVDRSFTDLTMCTGDVDFFSMVLFAGQTLTAVTDSRDGHPGIQMDLGTDGGVDLEADSIVSAGAWDNPADLDDTDDRILDRSVAATDEYYFRMQIPGGSAEAAYTFRFESGMGTARCERDYYDSIALGADRHNNTPENAQDLPTDSKFIIPSRPATASFEEARICPAVVDDSVDLDEDFYLVQIFRAPSEGFLQASLFQEDDALEMTIYEWVLDGEDRELVEMDTTGLPSGVLLTDEPIYERVGGTVDGEAAIYFVRVASSNPDDDELIPVLGESYSLTIDYIETPCEDDELEPNDSEHPELLHRATLLAGWGDGCGEFLTTTCGTDDTAFCECLPADNLVICPSDEDVYHLRFLEGDRYTVRVRMNGDDAEDNAEKVEVFFGREGSDQFRYGVDVTPACESANTCYDILIDGTANAPAGKIVATYRLTVDAGSLVAGADYDILVEVNGAGGRDCPPPERYDPWDLTPEDWDRYPGPNDLGCTDETCVLEPGTSASDHVGSLCSWDKDDWFSFTTEGGDIELYLRHFDEAGQAIALLYPDPLRDGIDQTVYECGFPADEDCPCLPELDPESDHYVCETQVSRSVADFPGREFAFYDLPAGDYQVRVRQYPYGGGFPNPYYKIFINDDACGGTVGAVTSGEGEDESKAGQVLWSVNEDCDTGHIGECSSCSDSCECAD